MKKTTSLMVMIAGLLLAGASTTAAQTPFGGKLFVNVNGGAQTQSRHAGQQRQPLGFQSDRLLDDKPVRARRSALRRQRRLQGLARSRPRPRILPFQPDRHGGRLGHDSKSDLLQSSHYPARINEAMPSAATATSTWWRCGSSRVAEKIDVALAIGPSFTRVRQDLVIDSQPFRENIVSAAASGANITPIITEQSGTAKGMNVGAGRPVHVHPDDRRWRLHQVQRRIGRSARRDGPGRRRISARDRRAAAVLIDLRNARLKLRFRCAAGLNHLHSHSRVRIHLTAGRSPAGRGFDRRTRCPASSGRWWSARPSASCRSGRPGSRCARPRSCIPSTRRCSRRRS